MEFRVCPPPLRAGSRREQSENVMGRIVERLIVTSEESVSRVSGGVNVDTVAEVSNRLLATLTSVLRKPDNSNSSNYAGAIPEIVLSMAACSAMDAHARGRPFNFLGLVKREENGNVTSQEGHLVLGFCVIHKSMDPETLKAISNKYVRRPPTPHPPLTPTPHSPPPPPGSTSFSFKLGLATIVSGRPTSMTCGRG